MSPIKSVNISFAATAAVGALTALMLAIAPAAAQQTTCRAAVQGNIAWDGRNDRSWTNEQLNKLCSGAETSTQPGQCFQTVMSGKVNYGSGTTWNPNNALDLCQGSTNASATISCFRNQLAQQGNWRPAIDACKARVVTMTPRAGAVVTTRPSVTPPPVSGQTEAATTAERDRVARISCRGPFKGRVYVPSFSDPAQQSYVVTLDFEGIDGGNPEPGQCSRSGGFGFP
ncbi:MAG: hypothetical protein AAF224_03895 [Pseudomonadota bacterium]